MKRVGQALLSPWFLYPLGAVLLSLLIWFAFPFIGFGGFQPFDDIWVRIGLIVFVFLVFGLLLFLSWRKRRKADKDLVEGIASAAADPTGEAISAERKQVEEKLRAALVDLRQTLGKGGQALYQLPWYAIIGPPGAGKTTALLNSGLRFPLAERHGAQALKGVGGTRNCDWWFTEKAVILDTAGRWATQDSDSKVDQAAWNNFLAMLKRTRERQPLNGILVVFGVPDLLAMTRDERINHARAVRTRLVELQVAFGLTLPIYVVLTKLDMIAGFVEFFDDLDREGREQVVGLTVPLGTGNAADLPQHRFSALFDRLIERQRSRLLDRLQSERDLVRRTLIYGFPSQFASLGGVVDELLAETFNDSRFASRLSLRGVYFTSATQQGSPIDRLMEAISGKFGIQRQQLPPQVGQGRGFFLRRLFDDVIFNEAGLVGTNTKVERRRAIIRYTAFAATGLFFLTAVGLWTWSYFENRALIAKVESEIRRLEPEIVAAESQRAAAREPRDFDPRRHLRLLNDLRALPTGYEQQQSGKSEAVSFGLGQADRLALQTSELYKRGLRALLLPHVMVHTQTRMAEVVNKPRPPAAEEPAVNEYLFDALKTYLLFGDTSKFSSANKTFAVDWLKKDMGDTPAIASDAAAIATHVAALVKETDWDPITMDEALIARVRQRIATLTVASRALRRLESDEALRNRPVWQIINNVGAQRAVAEEVLLRRSGQTLATDGIPYLYTRRGYYEFFVALVGPATAAANTDAWVVRQDVLTGLAAQNQAVNDTVKNYMERYINYYKAVLDDVRVVRLSDLEQGADVLNKLSSADSPIRNLYEAIARETRLSAVQKVDPAFTEVRANFVRRLVQNIQEAALWFGLSQRLLGDGGEPGKSVDREFQALHNFVGPEGAATSPLTAFLENFKTLAGRMSDARSPGNPGGSAAVSQLARQIADRAGQFPRPVPEIARTIASDAGNLGTKATREQMAAEWDSQIFGFCQRNIINSYPINLALPAARDATSDDFTAMFAKGGRIDKFMQQYLQIYLDTGSNPWRWKPETLALGFNQQVPAVLQAAVEIQESFFGAGGGALNVIFTLRATEGQAKGAKLEIAGDVMPLEPGSSPKNITWPTGAGRGARVSSDFNDQTFDGLWAFMRMMIASSPAGGGPEWRLRLSNGVSLQLEFQKNKNPLTARTLLGQRKFLCVPFLQQ
ncbi:MAG TPA: type VI secretion system membrane subunit TssM [Vineibacter sp.]|nr:type VI secretion system membrane subunit TssM [Vineibacter sp.]